MGETGTIEVTAKFSALAFMYAIVKATVEVDGAVVARGWGTHRIESSPVTTSFKSRIRGSPSRGARAGTT